jgi:signal transduction histidine kinase
MTTATPSEPWGPSAILVGLWLGLSAAVALAVWRTYPTPSPAAVILDDSVRLFFTAVAAGTCLWRSKRSHSAYVMAWRHLGTAFLWLTGAVAYLVVAVDVFRMPAPWSLLRHIGYLANLIYIARATLAWPIAPGLPSQRIQALLDGFMIAAALFFIAWGGFLRDLVAHVSASNSAYALTLIYPAAAVALAALWLFQEARLSRSRAPVTRSLLRLGLLSLLAFYILYAILSIHGSMRTFGIAEAIDQLETASLALFGLAALWPQPPDASAPLQGRPPVARVIPFLPSLGAMGYGAWLLLMGRPLDPIMVAAGTALGLVLFVRQHLALRDLEQLSQDLELRVEARTEELRLKQSELLKAQRTQMVALLAAGFAHDFKNLLNIILTWTELMISGDSEEDRREGLQAIRISGRRGSELIQQVLAAGHQQELHPSTFDLAVYLSDLLPTLRGALRERARLVIEVPDDFWIHMDPEQLHQVLLNLVGNAADAMPHPGTVTLRARRDPLEPFVVLDVADDGSGIPPDVLEHIFEPFFTTKAPGKGTGLGLASVQGILWQSGGSISVASRVGRGTTFSLRLPAPQVR